MNEEQQLVQIAREAAARHGLDPALVCAVCHHESAGWHTWASRYEPGFYEQYVMPIKDLKTFGPTISRATERKDRATSYGLMQIMGQTAREFGFVGEYLTELCDPATGTEYACRKLARCMKLAGGDVRAALMKYNGGGNANYPNLVLAHVDQYK